MRPTPTPAILAFVASMPDPTCFGELLIRRTPAGFELLHVRDTTPPARELATVPLPNLRRLAQFAADGTYRPLKSAPTLVSGWRASAGDPAQLEDALGQLYPGAIPDFFAALERLGGRQATLLKVLHVFF